MDDINNYLHTTKDEIISLIEQKKKKKVSKIFEIFLKTLKTVEEDTVKTKFYDLIGELIENYPRLLTDKTYKSFISNVNLYLPWVQRIEMEHYIIKKYCYFRDEVFIMGFNGTITMTNKFDKRRKQRYRGRCYVTNYRIILQGYQEYAGGFSLWSGWLGYILDKALTKSILKNITTVSGSEKKPIYGYSFPFIGAYRLRRRQNYLSYGFKFEYEAVLYSDKKSRFDLDFKVSNDKIAYILEKAILINNQIEQDPDLICPNCKTVWKKKSMFCGNCGEKTALGEYYSLINEAFSFASDEKHDEAIKYIDDAERIWLNKGIALVDEVKYEEAIKYFDDGIKVNQQNPDLLATYWSNKGKAFFLLKKYVEAIECYNKLPPTYEKFLNKALAFTGLEMYNEAIDYYNNALRKKPKDTLILINIGNAYLYLKKSKKAIKYFNKAVKYNPDDPIAWIKKAEAFKNLGKQDQMVSCCEMALKLDPNNSSAQKMLKG